MEMAGEHIDFDQIRDALSVGQVLAHYGVELKASRKPNSLRGPCPLHKGTSNSFGFDTERKIYNCFKCGESGTLVKFVAKMEGVGLQEAAKIMRTWIGMVPMVKPELKHLTKPVQERPARNVPLSEKWGENAGLKGLDHAHPYLAERGFSPETCEEFGVGYFPGRGTMAGRIAFPIHDSLSGELVGYCGRLVDEAKAWRGKDGKRVPPRWDLPDGLIKCDLFNFHRLQDAKALYVVESPWGALWLHQAGYPNVVATMGKEMTEQQIELLRDVPDVTLLFDGDEAGRAGSRKIGAKLLEGERRSVRVIFLPDGAQPDSIPEEELACLL